MAQAIDDHQADATSMAEDHSATAAAEEIAGGSFIAARNKQTRTQLEAAILEQLMVDTVRERNADSRSMTTIVNYLRDGSRIGTAPVEGSRRRPPQFPPALKGCR